MNPFFSIIIPTYNRGHVIRRAIDSVVNQSFQEFEIIVVDDGSSDNTRQLVESLPHKEKIFYVRQENKGASAARNLGASKAKGDYLIFLDSDDYLGEIALAGYFNVLHSGPFKLAMGYSIYVNGAGKLLSRVHPWKDETSFRHPLSGSFAVDHRTFTGLGGYDENLSFSETSDLFLRISIGKIISIEEIAITRDAGVYIDSPDSHERKMRYTKKRYESIKYFLDKHRVYFDNNLKDFLNFKSIHAMSSLQNDQFEEAKACLREVSSRAPFSWRIQLRYYFVLFAPWLAKWYYGR